MSESTCKMCNGSGRIPLPRGMSVGFYWFMATGCDHRDDGTLLMLCECAKTSHSPPVERVEAGGKAWDAIDDPAGYLGREEGGEG